MRGEGGYSLVELVVVMAILGVIVGGIVTLFATGITASADQTRRYQAQQDARIALDKIRRDVHTACAVSNPSTYNTAESSITLYYTASGSCASGTNSISWCAIGAGTQYKLFRNQAANCTGATQFFADFLTNGTPFTYLPPNSHVTSLGGGAPGIATVDGSYVLARLHIDLQVNRSGKPTDAYRLVDDIAFRNGPRWCGSGGPVTC